MKKLEILKSSKFEAFLSNEIQNQLQIVGGTVTRSYKNGVEIDCKTDETKKETGSNGEQFDNLCRQANPVSSASSFLY